MNNLMTYTYKTGILLTLSLSIGAPKAQNIIVNSYNGQPEIKTYNGAITLANGFFVPAGSNVHIYIPEGNPPVSDMPAALTATQNYTATRIANAPISDTNTFKTSPLQDVKLLVQYTDGFDHLMQTVFKQGSLVTATGASSDLISFFRDSAKTSYQYLPYAGGGSDGSYKTGVQAALAAFYNNSTGPLAGQAETSFYSRTEYEADPLNSRVLKAYAPGKNWAGSERGTENKFFFNKTADTVQQWMVADVTTPGSGFGSYSAMAYQPHTLRKTITINEEQKQVITYTDIDGRLILKKVQLTAAADNGAGSGYSGWLCTYYIYDDAGRIRCVVQPAGVAALAGSGWTMTANILDEQCFRYEYDGLGQLIMKQTPGAGAVYTVYDAKSRPVMVQDANMRAQHQWIASQYDRLNRPAYTYTYTTTTAFTALLTAAAASNAYPAATPPASPAKLSEIHYDDYTGLPAGLSASYLSTWDSYFDATSTSSFPYPEMPAKNTSPIGTNGMVTWAAAKVLLDTTPVMYLGSVNIYDHKGRLIQTQQQNITGGTDVTTIQYSWAGWPLVVVDKREKKGANEQTTVVVTKMTYDDLGRVIKTDMKQSNTKVNNGAMTAYATISENEYNALGQVKKRLLGKQRSSAAAYSSTPLETQDYDYNIRGWLLGVNRAYARNEQSTNNAATPYATQATGGEMFTESGMDIQSVTYPTTNYFGFDLGYDKAQNNLINNQSYAAARYDGNITGTVWKNAYDNQIRRYDYSYDAVSRLTAAGFSKYNGSVFVRSYSEDYSVDTVTYDGNGNILRLNQKAYFYNMSESGDMDVLTYHYEAGSNKLIKVNDERAYDDSDTLMAILFGEGDFHGGVLPGDDYAYDANGNLISDRNKKISLIAYNYLNLPQQISVTGKGSIYYVYDAAGNKLRRTTVDSTAAKVTTTLYLGSTLYQDDTLQFFGTGEGRARPAGNAFVYDYFLKDQLGNTRVVITDDYNVSSPILEASSYYPFGLEQREISFKATGSLANRYKFNGGSELNSDFGIGIYETAFRSLDPQLGRFWQIDPLAEHTPDVSPFAFVGNNPVMFLDPLGLQDTTNHPIHDPAVVYGQPIWWYDPLNTGAGVEHGPAFIPLPDNDLPTVTVNGYIPKPKPKRISVKPQVNRGPGLKILAFTGVATAATSEVPPVAAIIGIAGLTATGAYMLYEHSDDLARPFIQFTATVLMGYERLFAEHTKNARPSTKGKHEKANQRRNQDRNGSKGMKKPPRKKPVGWTGKWPPQ